MLIKFSILILTALAGANVHASSEILHRLVSCSSKLIATLKTEFTLQGQPMPLPARERKSDLVSWSANSRHPTMRSTENKDVLYIAGLEKMIAPNLDLAVAQFLRHPHGFLSILQFPNAQDRIHVETLVYSKSLGRPSRMIYANTDFSFEVLEKEVVVEMKNLNSTKNNVRLNLAYWMVTHNASRFPYITFGSSVYYFPVERFNEFIATFRSLGYEFY